MPTTGGELIEAGDPPVVKYALREFFDHTGIPPDGPWFLSGSGDEIVACVREGLAPVAQRILREWSASSKEEPEGVLLDPWWTRAEWEISRKVRELAGDMGIPFVQKEPWPERHPFAAVITHDVDILHPTADFASNRVLAHLRMSLPRRHGANLRDLLRVADLDLRLGVPTSFYLLQGYPGIPDSELIPVVRGLVDRGFEIGLHASPDCRRDGRRLEAERRHLEALVSGEVLGARMHLLAFEPEHTWRAETEAGLTYDSSFGWNHASGFRGGSALPFHAFDPSGGVAFPVVELPLAYMDWTGFQQRGQHDDIEVVLRTLTAWVRDVHGVLVVNFHNSYLNRWTHRENHRAFTRMVRWIKDEHAWLTTARDCVNWWTRRREAGLTVSIRDQALRVENPGRLALATWYPGSTAPTVLSEREATLPMPDGHRSFPSA